MRLLDYDDLIERAGTLLGDSDVAAWVLYKLDNGIDHVLVDEAQDTNPANGAIVRRWLGRILRRTGRAGGWPAPSSRSATKSSRSSRSRARTREIFEDTRRHFAEAAEKAAGQPFGDVTAQPLLPLDRGGAVLCRRGLRRPRRRRTASPGAASSIRCGARARRGSSRSGRPSSRRRAPEIRPGRRHLASTPRTSRPCASPTRSRDRIACWIGKEKLDSKDRPIEPGDIMVLVRRRNEFVDALVNALKRRGVPVSGTDRMVLTDQLAVMDLIALGRFMLLPEDDLTLAVVLKCPLIGLSENDLFALAHRARRARSGRSSPCGGWSDRPSRRPMAI